MKKSLLALVIIIFSLNTAKAGELVIYNVSEDGWIFKAGATIYVDDKSIGFIGSNQVLRKSFPDGPHIITVRLYTGVIRLPNFKVLFVANKKPTYYRFRSSGDTASLIPMEEKIALRRIAGFSAGEAATTRKNPAKKRARARTNFNR